MEPLNTTKEDVRRWVLNGLERGATHVIVVCDTFDYSDYPVYVMPDQNFATIKSQYNNVNMQRIMETFDLTEDLTKRLG